MEEFPMRNLTLIRVLLLAVCIPLALASMATSASAQIAVGISVRVPPPAIPVYVQPPCPTEGYLWTPGYWAYANDDYYWVPGVWVAPPSAGLLWTPGYWGFAGGVYGFHAGYWGPHVGFYGGVNYGFGFGGVGFVGGEWRGGVFAYNRAVANFGSVHITNVNVNHVSFNGGEGIQVHASAMEMQAANEHHFEATAEQVQHEHFAAQDRAQ